MGCDEVLDGEADGENKEENGGRIVTGEEAVAEASSGTLEPEGVGPAFPQMFKCDADSGLMY